ncbi:SDA1 domain-containing protein [Dunaliella salina]|uniref:Protein SDA1 n=1 Tax=Dunaliella salina TaxID=3046 RepID=A0ABZ3K8Z9_DUNSA|nr:SDA1 domain-containing protein [Dunaliella salina]|eukprot:KAF5825647.1 SDA1 domain-containing protein [Dunaliella salina]
MRSMCSLQDLTLYKKFKNKQVSASARGLIGLFRELNPELLAKKDRGKGVDMMLRPAAYGQSQVASRVDGAELLEAAEAAGQGSEEDDFHMSSSSSSDEENSGSGKC